MAREQNLSIQETLENLLWEAKREDPRIKGVVLISPEGLMLAQAGEVGIEDQDVLSGVLASMLGFSQTVVNQLGLGRQTKRAIIEGNEALAIVRTVGAGYLLAVVAEADAMLGVLFMVIKRLVASLEGVLAQLEVA